MERTEGKSQRLTPSLNTPTPAVYQILRILDAHLPATIITPFLQLLKILEKKTGISLDFSMKSRPNVNVRCCSATYYSIYERFMKEARTMPTSISSETAAKISYAKKCLDEAAENVRQALHEMPDCEAKTELDYLRLVIDYARENFDDLQDNCCGRRKDLKSGCRSQWWACAYLTREIRERKNHEKGRSHSRQTLCCQGKR